MNTVTLYISMTFCTILHEIFDFEEKTTRLSYCLLHYATAERKEGRYIGNG